MTKFQLFFKAIDNEIAIDADVLRRMQGGRMGFLPLRPFKTRALFEYGNRGKLAYRIFLVFFFLSFPFLVFFQVLISLFGSSLRRKEFNCHSLLLNANGKSVSLFLGCSHEPDFFSVDFAKGECFLGDNCISVRRGATLLDVIGAGKDSYFAFMKFLCQGRSFGNLPQLYVTFDWFLSYRFLVGFRDSSCIKEIYFANHYDRWAVMFDCVFQRKKIVLMQHGKFPEQLELKGKLANIDEVVLLNPDSKRHLGIFVENPELLKISFVMPKLDLSVVDSPSGMTVLIIGQPQSVEHEITLMKILSDNAPNLCVLLKPHPVHGVRIYKGVPSSIVLVESNCFPKTDLAICFESTLGTEYESMGIPVIWWGKMKPVEVAQRIRNFFDKKST
ncbi:hypothetical protein [Marinobacter nauticus]|uniref:hypothetical protein n=1 Tax=Marinobacter nauticus TaxID=2743 RepID=UPI00242F461C|nr:hypothetical protein [Marinobacter nauticus]